MKLPEFKSLLSQSPEKLVNFVLPDGDIIPANYHVTEVGYVTKRFVDCGGTRRDTATCQLQVWLGNDAQHRLTAGKLAGILELAKDLIPSGDVDLEIEYEDCSLSQYPVTAGEITADGIKISLGSKHTDCLAKEACGIEAASSCCGGEGCGS